MMRAGASDCLTIEDYANSQSSLVDQSMTYQQAIMSQAEVEEFLQVPRFAIVGTIRKQGAPQLTPVWYLYENGRLYVSVGVKSAKYRNLSRDPRVCICIAAEHPDARAVMIYGTAEFIPDESDWSDDIHWRIIRHYHDSDQEAQAFIDSLPSEDASALIAVTPDKVIADDWN
jgi:PPOX class probable F420-dependent enzyme